MTNAYRVKPQQTAHQKRPKIMDAKHLECIRQMPCVISRKWPVEAAHVRFASAAFGKPETGKQTKPDDKWCVPLTKFHHQDSDKAQHKGNEQEFWQRHNINILLLCEELYAVTGDLDHMRELIFKATRGEFPCQ